MMDIKNIKPRWSINCLVPAVTSLLGLSYISSHFANMADPMKFNEAYGENAYTMLFGTENNMSFIFGLIATVLAIAMFLDTFLRHKVSHIIVSLLGALLTFAYGLGKAIWALQNPWTQSGSCAALLFVSIVGIGGMVYFFLEKSLNGDAGTPYWAFFYAGAILFYFGIVMKYSLLDFNSHQSDAVFWEGYASSRLVLLTFIAAGIMNSRSDYDPNPIQLDEFGNPIDDKK